MKQRIWLSFSVAVVVVFCLQSLPTVAQGLPQIIAHREQGSLPKLMVIGSPHFANPGLDNINIDVDDMLSEEQQKGITELIDTLLKFRPTHVVVEVPAQRQTQLDQRYQAYLGGTTDPSRSEIDQIGMRLAKATGHTRIFGVDWQGDPPGGFTDDFNWHEYAQESGFEEHLAAVSDPSSIAQYAEQGDRTMSEWFADLNSLEGLLAFHRTYFDIALIGDTDSSPGANWVGHWYTRNLMIFNNVVRLSQREDDRILVIYGAGHAYLLRQFAIESGAFDVIDLNKYL